MQHKQSQAIKDRITRLECDNYHDTSRNVKFVIYRDEVEIDNKFYIE